MTVSATADPPLALQAEVTHRCPLRCLYCSNPLKLSRRSAELDRETWQRVFDEAAKLGVLQVHFSGGEPLARSDLADLIWHAANRGLYTNLITSGIGLDETRLASLVEHGLEHVQLSIQDSDLAAGDEIAGLTGAQTEKRAAARRVTRSGLPLTVNAVIHRRNIERLSDMIDLAVSWGAERLEVAHVQYYGWALVNRSILMPTRDQLHRATETTLAARERLKGIMTIDYVPPDYYARRPKACMGGWARGFMLITPAGRALPCHAAETLPGLDFPDVRSASLSDIWHFADLFRRFRGTEWMSEPCRTCERREIDWGGCRCQALALTGDPTRTDPACALAPDHAIMVEAREAALAEGGSGSKNIPIWRSFGVGG